MRNRNLVIMKSKTGLFLIVVLLCATACSKTKRYANRLSGETWKITSVSIGQVPQQAEKYASLIFEDCDIFEDTCHGQWSLDTSKADFIWQVNDQGKTFILACLTLYEDVQGTEEGGQNYDALKQCQFMSGYYTIDKMKKKTMEISSNETAGYRGVKVEMVLERND